jgi:GMP synthase (glutamine-hydrolysing)
MDKFVTRDFDRDSFDPDRFIGEACEKIREKCEGRRVFNLVSGGVDSTVVFALLNKALGPERVLGVHVDTGLMRLNESAAILEFMNAGGFDNLRIEDAEDDFMTALDGVYEPEKKRRIIGDLYLSVKDKVSKRLGLNAGEWILAQGTIYPDVLETAAKGEDGGKKIKTHHNRVDAIMELVEKGLIVEPVAPLYKDEVRAVGEKLGLPRELVWRHPFPGPGLGVRVLCSDGNAPDAIPERDAAALNDIVARAGYRSAVLPLRCTGNKGGERTYTRPVLIHGAFDWDVIERLVAEITASVQSVNRIVYALDARELPTYGLIRACVTRERLDRLRAVDAAVTDALRKTGEYDRIWQMPVIALPLVNERTGGQPCVLRPIHSTDAMEAKVVRLGRETLDIIADTNRGGGGIKDLLLDVTPKPPATIEWE